MWELDESIWGDVERSEDLFRSTLISYRQQTYLEKHRVVMESALNYGWTVPMDSGLASQTMLRIKKAFGEEFRTYNMDAWEEAVFDIPGMLRHVAVKGAVLPDPHVSLECDPETGDPGPVRWRPTKSSYIRFHEPGEAPKGRVLFGERSEDLMVIYAPRSLADPARDADKLKAAIEEDCTWVQGAVLQDIKNTTSNTRGELKQWAGKRAVGSAPLTASTAELLDKAYFEETAIAIETLKIYAPGAEKSQRIKDAAQVGWVCERCAGSFALSHRPCHQTRSTAQASNQLFDAPLGISAFDDNFHQLRGGPDDGGATGSEQDARDEREGSAAVGADEAAGADEGAGGEPLEDEDAAGSVLDGAERAGDNVNGEGAGEDPPVTEDAEDGGSAHADDEGAGEQPAAMNFVVHDGADDSVQHGDAGGVGAEDDAVEGDKDLDAGSEYMPSEGGYLLEDTDEDEDEDAASQGGAAATDAEDEPSGEPVVEKAPAAGSVPVSAAAPSAAAPSAPAMTAQDLRKQRAAEMTTRNFGLLGLVPLISEDAARQVCDDIATQLYPARDSEEQMHEIGGIRFPATVSIPRLPGGERAAGSGRGIAKDIGAVLAEFFDLSSKVRGTTDAFASVAAVGHLGRAFVACVLVQGSIGDAGRKYGRIEAGGGTGRHRLALLRQESRYSGRRNPIGGGVLSLIQRL
ncbi:hypothetical protein DFJ74DRAFT_62548 [Hyaloraphidium curvatum]|nr:hypothetical protein DFJ74DRAFT_62548 [Hyaloraphidium curvatum]